MDEGIGRAGLPLQPNGQSMKDVTKDTILVHAGRDPRNNHGIVNPPVYHCSTVLFPTLDALEESDRNMLTSVNYGRMGTPTTFTSASDRPAVASMRWA